LAEIKEKGVKKQSIRRSRSDKKRAAKRTEVKGVKFRV